MNQSKEINKLVNYIEGHNEFIIVKSNVCFYNNHLGAVLTDIILQAGLNYKSVVLPRVMYVFNNFNEAKNLKGLIETLKKVEIAEFLSWKNQVKIDRFNNVIDYLSINNINTTFELVEHLNCKINVEKFLNLNGIGNKTVDYFLKLMHVETIAVDRHIINFLNQAEVEFNSYHGAKRIVEYTADILDVSRRDIDYSIWNYMSEKSKQYSLEFSL